jgi:hypothetical protein
MAREHRQLATIIREHGGAKRADPADKLVMRAQASPLVWRGQDEGIHNSI